MLFRSLVDQDLDEILETVSFSDKIIFGRTNYNKIVSSYPNCKSWYNECAVKVVSFCLKNNINYYIKNGTWTADASIDEVALFRSA